MLPTLIISLLILAACVAVTYRGVKNRRQGKHSCSCGGSCGACGGACHSHHSHPPAQ